MKFFITFFYISNFLSFHNVYQSKICFFMNFFFSSCLSFPFVQSISRIKRRRTHLIKTSVSIFSQNSRFNYLTAWSSNLKIRWSIGRDIDFLLNLSDLSASFKYLCSFEFERKLSSFSCIVKDKLSLSREQWFFYRALSRLLAMCSR